MTTLRMIAGLGNPDDKYLRTLHNAGFWFVDELARKFGGSFRYEKKFDAECCKISVDGDDIWLVKPQSYMNHSGGPVRAALDYYRLSPGELLVAHDELDLPPGTVRLKKGGGHGGHNGLRDLIPHLGGNDFLRLRIGIGHPGHRDDVVGYVLKAASREDRAAIDQAIDAAVSVLPDIIAGNLDAAMKELHTRVN